jgi:hypothetical protein
VGWRAIPLKPARGFSFALKVGGLDLDASALCYQPLDSPRQPGLLGIRVFVDPALVAEETILEALWLVVETGVGEEAAADVGHLEAASRERAPIDPFSIEELARTIERHRESQRNPDARRLS